MKNTIIYLFSAFLLTACVYPFEADLESSAHKAIVIDANILLGNKSTIRLYYLQPLDVGQRYVNSGNPVGSVYLQDEAGITYNAKGSNGNYTLDVPETVTGKLKLTVVADGNTYVSDLMDPVNPPVIQDVRFSADDYYVYVLLSMEDDGNGSGYAAVQYDEIWKFHTDFVRNFGYNEESNSVYALETPADEHYWCWKKRQPQSQQLVDYTHLGGKVQNYVAVKFSRADNRNHEEYDVRLKVWNLTPEQYKYRKMLEENASISGNLFSPEPGEIRGNLHCENNPEEPVYGYVNIARVSLITKVLPSTYSTWKPQYRLTEISNENWFTSYAKGYMPIDYIVTEEGSALGWGEARCWDCIAAGGTLDKPDFE